MKKNRFIVTIPKLIFFYLLIQLWCISCTQKNNAVSNNKKEDSIATVSNIHSLSAVNNVKEILQDGQLVTRSDNDFESLILQNFSRRERVYSHSGIVFKEDSGYMVYHCMGGEENPGGACKRDPFDSFVNPLQKTGFGIFQYQLSKIETVKLHHVLEQDYQSKIPFDTGFNLKTDDSLYCSEMIYKALKQATNSRIILPTSYIDNFKPKIMGYKHNNLFFKKFEFIGIDDLYLNPFCKEIMRVKYQ